MGRPKTIQIFLPDGSPQGLKVAEITNRIIYAVQIPRAKLDEASKRDETKRVGVYFLFGHDKDEAKPLVYIGEAENCLDRIKQHNQQKDFWTLAVCIVAKTDDFTKTHGKFLEHYCLEKAKEIARYKPVNSVQPKKPHVTEVMEADLMESFDTIKILLSTLGHPIFEPTSSSKNQRLFFLKRKNANAVGEYIDDGFVVKAGSQANIDETPSNSGSNRLLRKKLVEGGILKEVEGVYVFTADYVFNYPSGASDVVLGASSNGWTEWKNKQGQTLDEIIRKKK